MPSLIRFALVGNPNCGKTSLFNRLTGSTAKVANYPGVTVEKRSGRVTQIEIKTELLDLPGTYSLFVASPDEQVAKDVILGSFAGEAKPDLLIAVVDACNLRLGLRLVMELRSLNRPMIVALNQMDEAKRRGISIDTAGLSREINLHIIETIALKKQGVTELREFLNRYAQNPWVLPDEQVLTLKERKSSIETLYAEIESLISQYVTQPSKPSLWQDRLDALVMHPVLGLVLLFGLLLVIFQAVFAWATPLVNAIDGLFVALSGLVSTHMPQGILRDFIADGLIAGIGGVLVFMPQILILFFFILVLEDSGYLTRAAFLLDRPMRGLGLSGRSFIPMLSSFACAVPGIMATRTIADPRERFVTIMVAPLMTCSARLPVYTLIIAAFIPQETLGGFFNLQGITLFVLYIAGVVSAALIAWLMRQRAAREEFPLLLELPSYRRPSVYHLAMGLRERAWIFIRRVGTIILSLTVILWFLANFPGAPENATGPAIDYSFAGQLGHMMQPLFAPLGFNWQMCIALIPAMGAREVAVSALATVYAVGDDAIETTLGATLAADWSLPVAFAYLAWFVYAPQCISTIAVVKRETNSIKSTAFFTAYLFVLAYLAAWVTYQLATFLLF